MSDRGLMGRFELALAEIFRGTIRNCGGEIWEANGVVSWASSLRQAPSPYANGVMRTTRTMSPREVVGATARFFSVRDHGYTLLARSDDRALWSEVEGYGRTMNAERSAMVTTEAPSGACVPEGVDLRPVENAAGMLDFCQVVASSLGSEEDARPLVNGVLRRVQNLMGPRRWGVVAYEGGAAAACALITLVEGTASVGWICTKPEYRRRGLATATVGAAVRTGFERGADLATVLSPPALVPLLDSLKFKEIGGYREYVLP